MLELLLKHGAATDQVDYMGKLPVDYLDVSYEKVIEIISEITDAVRYPFGDSGFNQNYSENESFVATLPTRDERKENIEKIKLIMLKKEIGYITQKQAAVYLADNSQTFFSNACNLPKPDLKTYSLPAPK